MLLPELKRPQTGSRDLNQFYGYNAQPSAGEAEFRGMANLWGGHFPMLNTRPPRGTVAKLKNPQGMIAKDALLWVDDGEVYYNSYKIPDITLTRTGVKQIVSMGAYAVFFPDKKYVNTTDFEDCGTLDAAWEAETETAVTFTICREDGNAYDQPAVQGTAPQNPDAGALWIDTSGEMHVLRQYDSTSQSWTSVATVYTKLTAPGIGEQFSDYDGVEISGCGTGVDGNLGKQLAALNGTKVIYKRDADFLVVVGILDQTYTQTGGISVRREAPALDYVCECGNRLWGCKYGLVNGKPVNEIYCCKLGDFKNWRCYMGLSTDSWAASRGADGQFTGAATYQGRPIFFRERSLEVVYPDAGGAHQIVTNECAGVQNGSWRSLAIVSNTLFYKSPEGVRAYTGSMPYSVSDALGDTGYHNARAGAVESRYYISMQDKAGRWHLFCYDAGKRLWHREDATQAAAFASADGDLFYQDERNPALRCCLGRTGDPEEAFEWNAETGLIGMDDYRKKYPSRISFRGSIQAGGWMEVWMQYDSNPEWEFKCRIAGAGLRSFLLPITPKRCDHMRIRLKGKGKAMIYSIHMNYEKGTDV